MRSMYNSKIGDPSSEFGYINGGQRFEEKVQKRVERHEQLWNAFVEFMHQHDVTPAELRTMFIRYHEEFLQG